MVRSIDDQRAALRIVRPKADRRHRVLFVGTFAQGPTDIVASLKRALANLGHTVFHLDPAVHRAILDKSSGARGGYGPIYLRPDAIRTVLDRFRPQVLVLCAGGMVLDEAGAAECRDRGIVIVGMTLSDPDVQPSVIDHVGVFDYHTTNAALALERYTEQGVTNTFLMPFGIDRDFALRTVDPDPRLDAEVICIGHAPGRTDRHEVMGALLDRFNVRLYGSGWPFPGAAPVSGDRLLQAAAAGTFHVNFPATRAGFTNVKCGVFESVAAGGVLCTQVFDEMANLFEYGTEIVGYVGPDDLADSLEHLIKEPDRIEAMRRRAFERLVNEHLYEHRWTALFRSITEDVGSASPRVGAERAAEVAAILRDEAPTPRTFLVSGYYGAQNRGDDILLEAVTQGIEARLPDANIVVAARHKTNVELEHGLQAFDRADHLIADYWASRASAVVLGPGGLWDDYSINRAGGAAGIVTGALVSPAHLAQLPVLTVAHGGDFHVFGIGVGPLSSEPARSAVRLSGQLASSVVVRDATSRELLEELPRFGCDVEQAPDIVYAATLPEADGAHLEPRPRPYIAVNVRPWFADVGLAQIRAAVVDLALDRGLDIVGVPMQPRDEQAIIELFDGLPEGIDFSLVRCEAPFGEFTGVLADAAAVVAMRLHTSLIAHRLGTPTVGLAYDPKVREHFVEVNRADSVLGLPVDREKLGHALREALTDGSFGSDSTAKIRQLESDAGAAVAALAERLGAAPAREVAGGTIHQQKQEPVEPPFGWKVGEVVDVGSGVLSSGNLHDSSRTVEYGSALNRSGLRLNLTDSAPQKGDYLSWRLAVPAREGEGVRVEVVIRNVYREASSRRGRIAYEVVVDGTPVLRHDVAAWKPSNSIWIAKRPEGRELVVDVRLVALRDCEDWSWGPAAQVVIEGVRARPWPGSNLTWGASSPAVQVLTDGAFGGSAAGSRRPSVLRRVARRLRKVAGR